MPESFKELAMKLHVNVDHVATLREARGTPYPDPVEAARLAIRGGADGITMHLREDRRHIKDRDLEEVKATIDVPLNMEMAATDEMIAIALGVRPAVSTLVPERREEQTTERGLFADGRSDGVTAETVRALKAGGVRVSLFVDPVEEILERAARVGADRVELHTGAYCLAGGAERERLLAQIRRAVEIAAALGMAVAAGHGLAYDNVAPIARLRGIEELSIGHAIVGRAVFVGMEQAVREMKSLIA
jgi:pyridoxine 5-phosphate synthase